MHSSNGTGPAAVGAGAHPGAPASIPRSARFPYVLGHIRLHLEAEQARWFLWFPVALGIGIACYLLLPWEPDLAASLLPLAGAVVLRWAGPRSVLGLLACSALLAASAGFALAKLRTESVRAPVLGKATGARQLDGYVELVEPRADKRGQRLTLRVISLEGVEAAQTPYRVRVRTLRENASLQPGDAVRLKATLSPPPIPALPGDYDFARTAWFARLGAVGFASDAAQALPDAPTPPWNLRFAAAIERVRQAIGRRVTAALPGESGAIANALITGERGGISETTNQAFRDSGLFHILSISGLHMAIIAGAAFLSMRVALAAFPAVALRYPVKKWAAVGAMLAALGYLLISGSSFATVRSYVMISIMFIAILLDRPALALRNVALAALAILVVWPESLLDAGFQMSFAAVVALVSCYEWLRDRRAASHVEPGLLGRTVRAGALFLAGIVLTTLIASLAVAPFGLYHFHNTQAYAVLANLIAIPACNILVMPAALATLVAIPLGLEAGPLWLMGLGIDVMTWCARGVAGLPGAVGRVPTIPTPAFALVVAGGLWLTLWRTRWRLYGLLPIAAGIMLAPTATRPDVLVGRNAELVAVRGPSGVLSALTTRGNFELARWLEHDGDRRSVADAGKAEAWRCDEAGCTARVGGLTLAVAKSPAALRDDCRTAQIVVLRQVRTGACPSARVLIDRAAVDRFGAHAIYIGREGGLRVETVAEGRGRRPWATSDAGSRERAIDAAAPPREAPASGDPDRDEP